MEYIEKNPQNIVQKLSKKELLDVTQTEGLEVVLEGEQNGGREVQGGVEGRERLRVIPSGRLTLRLRRLLLLPDCLCRLRVRIPSS